MALYLPLYPVIFHHETHASQTSHVTIFRLLILVKNDYEITVKEALHINFEKPTINRQLFTQGSSFVLTIF